MKARSWNEGMGIGTGYSGRWDGYSENENILVGWRNERKVQGVSGIGWVRTVDTTVDDDDSLDDGSWPRNLMMGFLQCN